MNIKTNLVICQNLKSQKLLLPDAHQRKCSQKFHKLHRKNTHAEVSPYKTTSPQARSFIKKRRNTSTPHETRKTSKNTLLYRTLPMMATSGERQNMIYFKSQRAILIYQGQNRGNYPELINHKPRSSWNNKKIFMTRKAKVH